MQKIFVMADGVIVEEGTHDELVAKKAKYYRMLKVKFASVCVSPFIQHEIICGTEEDLYAERKFSTSVLRGKKVLL